MIHHVPLTDVRRKFEHPNCDRVFHAPTDAVCASCGAQIPELRAGEPLWLSAYTPTNLTVQVGKVTHNYPRAYPRPAEPGHTIYTTREHHAREQDDNETRRALGKAQLLLDEWGAALDELHSALAPFAAEAERRAWITNLSPQSGLDAATIGGSQITNGDLRRAMTVYRQTAENPGVNPLAQLEAMAETLDPLILHFDEIRAAIPSAGLSASDFQNLLAIRERLNFPGTRGGS